jgi:hypothetical protein
MKTQSQLIIEKQKELIKAYKKIADYSDYYAQTNSDYFVKLESELTSLDSQLQEEQKPSDDLFESLLIDVMKWQTETFGEATPLSKIRHLQKETDELADDLISSPYHGPENVMLRHEYADNFLLLFGSAMSAGFTFKDIIDAMREKLEICKTREWGKPDKDGVVEHIKPKTK